MPDNLSDSKKGFGFWTGWFVVLASMVGSGILTNSGPILKSTGSYSGLLMIWAVGGVLAIGGALTLAELASGRPRYGGDYSFVKEAFGPALGFVYGWAMVIIGFAAPIALVAYTTANYLFPTIAPWFPKGFLAYEGTVVLAVASLLILFFTISHCLGHKSSSRVQALTTLFNFGLLLSLPIIALLSGKASVAHFSLGKSIASAPVNSWGSHLILVLYAYTGWNAAAYLSGEMRNPKKNLPWALTLGCVAVAALYVSVNFAYSLALSPERLATPSETQWSRLADVTVQELLGESASRIFSLLVSLGVLAALSAFILTGPRIVYAMAKDGLFPAMAGTIHEKSQVPVIAIIVQGALALIFLWSGTFEQVLNFAGYGLAVLGILTVAPIFVLRRKNDFHPVFKVPFYPLTPILFLAVSIWSLAMGFFDQPKLSLISIGTILLGFPLYYVFKLAVKRTPVVSF